MTTNWKGGNGQWQTAANWSNGAPTTPQAFAVINAAGTYTVTIGSGLEYNVGAVTLNAAGATLSIAGILDLKNKLTVSKGTLAVSGRINGGSIAAAGGKITFQNGTLDGVKYLGTLDLSTAANTVTIKDGLTLRGATGTGAGAMTLGGTSQIDFAGSQTVNGGKWTITGGTIAQTGTLTLGASEDVEYKAANSAFGTSASLANQGVVNIGKGAGLSAGQVTNGGKLTVNGGGAFGAATFTNTAAGSVAIYSGSGFVSDNFDNSGTFTADAGNLQLFKSSGGSFGNLAITNSTVELGNIASTTELNALETMLGGHGNTFTAYLSLDNTGETTTLAAPSGFKAFTLMGGIQGGTVTIDTTLTSGSLSNLTLAGSLTAANSLSLDNVTFTGTSGSGSATVHLSGELIVRNDNNLLDNVAVIGAAGSSVTSGQREPLSLGSNFSFTALGNGSIETSKLIINNGTIDAEGGAGSVFVFDGRRITNNGTIRVENGGIFQIGGRLGYLNNFQSGTLTGGTYDIGAHSMLRFEKSSPSITTLQANVALEGVGATFLAAGLATIGAQGSLSLQNGATLSVASAFKVDGELNLAGSSFTSANVTIDAGGTLDGHGTVLGAVANAGTIDASGGTLSITQGVTGTGAAEIENNATLSFGANVAAGQTVTFEGAKGTLALGNAGGFAGTIAGFAPGNAIDLINTTASAVTYNAGADTLTVKNKGTVIATLQLSGSYTGDTFGLAPDGKGGTEITVSAATPAVHRFIEAVAAFSPSGAASTGMHAVPDSSQITPALSISHHG
jgi:hypothetical protein